MRLLVSSYNSGPFVSFVFVFVFVFLLGCKPKSIWLQRKEYVNE